MRHYVQGKRIVIEDASLVELVVAHDKIIDGVSAIHTRQLREDRNILEKKEMAKKYAIHVAIKRDIEDELCKRAREKRFQ